MAGLSWSDAAAQAALVALLVSIVRPFLERYAPFAAVGAPTHDATLRALNLGCNLLAVLGGAVATGHFASSQWLAYVLAAAAQAAGSHTLYQMVKAPAVAAAAQTAGASHPAQPLDAAASAALAAQVHDAVATSLTAPAQ